MARLDIDNRTARRFWLDAQGLSRTPTGPLDLRAIIQQLGFVQLDTIRVVARAHDHILWSRNQNYREPMLDQLLRHERGVFEHFTHDASVLPIETYPMWQRQFTRLEAKVRRWEWHRGMLGSDGRNDILERIRHEGPLCTKHFDTKIKGKKEMWRRPPHKLALDYMWYAGTLTTAYRDGFTKYYDIAERLIPDHLFEATHSDEAQINWLCEQALSRLGFGSEGDIQRFWAATERREVKEWVAENTSKLIPVRVQGADRSWGDAWALSDIEDRIADMPAPTTRLRIVNPFDPVVRDRGRLSRLFGFDYSIEIFVPEAKREWGYYVYPLLEGDRFVGRIEVKADRKAGQLNVLRLWPEVGVKWTDARQAKLDAELARFARLADAKEVAWAPNAAIS